MFFTHTAQLQGHWTSGSICYFLKTFFLVSVKCAQLLNWHTLASLWTCSQCVSQTVICCSKGTYVGKKQKKNHTVLKLATFSRNLDIYSFIHSVLCQDSKVLRDWICTRCSYFKNIIVAQFPKLENEFKSCGVTRSVKVNAMLLIIPLGIFFQLCADKWHHHKSLSRQAIKNIKWRKKKKTQPWHQ